MKVTALECGITIIDGALSQLFKDWGRNIAMECVEDHEISMSDRWFDYACVYDTNFELIESSNTILKEYSQTSETNLQAPYDGYRATYTKQVSLLLDRLKLIDLSDLKSIETWCNVSRRDLHLDKDETKSIDQSIKTEDWPMWCIATFPDLLERPAEETGGQLCILPDSSDKIPVYFDESDSDKPNWWLLKEEFWRRDMSNSNLLLAADDNWQQVEYKPDRIVVWPGNSMHFTVPVTTQKRRFSIPINCWPKVYGEDKVV